MKTITLHNRKERFKTVTGFKHYQISSYGYVLTQKGTMMSEVKEKNGYRRVCLISDDGQKRMMYVHRLVQLAFRPKTQKKTVNHKNGIKWDNRLFNLEWATQKQNNRHALQTGAIPVSARIARPIKIEHQDFQIITKSMAEAARHLKVCHSAIKNYLNGHQLSVAGCQLEYAEMSKKAA